jgi:hypothetical protein
MAKWFSPKVPTPTPPPVPEPAPPAPTVDMAASNQDYLDKVRKRRGFASTIVVPDSNNSLGGSAAVLGG